MTGRQQEASLFGDVARRKDAHGRPRHGAASESWRDHGTAFGPAVNGLPRTSKRTRCLRATFRLPLGSCLLFRYVYTQAAFERSLSRRSRHTYLAYHRRWFRGWAGAEHEVSATTHATAFGAFSAEHQHLVEWQRDPYMNGVSVELAKRRQRPPQGVLSPTCQGTQAHGPLSKLWDRRPTPVVANAGAGDSRSIPASYCETITPALRWSWLAGRFVHSNPFPVLSLPAMVARSLVGQALLDWLRSPRSDVVSARSTLSRRLGNGSFAPVWLAHETYGSTTLRSAAVKFSTCPRGMHPSRRRVSSKPSWRRQERSAEWSTPMSCASTRCPSMSKWALRAWRWSTSMGSPSNSASRQSVAAALRDRCGREGSRFGFGCGTQLAGLVHRDVKPANIVSTSSVYKLIDFGVAAAGAPRNPGLPVLELRDAADLPIDTRLSSFGSLVSKSPRGAQSTVGLELHCGTMGYIDPTCLATGAPATPASDLYALGATLFRCLVGCVPALVESPGRTTISSAILRGTRRPPSLAKLVPSVPKSLAVLVDALLEPERAGRPVSAALVLERLEQIDWLLKRSFPASGAAHTRGTWRRPS